ncbi:PIG-L family deacetylase [bacterium]|nr:PIG-L family deacetylase [bacterium]
MNILALGSHPDDIEFGCGATLLKFAQMGHKVYLFVATYGELGGDWRTRKKEQMNSADYMGVEKIFWGEYSDCQLPLSRQLIMRIEDVITEVDPDFIFVHYDDDTHQDHRVLASATLSATRYIPNFLFYEGPTTLNFSPNVYVDIGNTIKGKKVLLKKHASQVRKVNVNMPDISILDIAESTAYFRGIQARMKIAEAFKSVRLFIDIPKAGDECTPAKSGKAKK